MDDCKGVRHEYDSKDTSQRVAYDIGRALLELLGWASPALVILAFVVVAFGVHAPKAYALSARSAPEMVIDGNFIGDDAGSKGYMCAYCSPYTATLELIGHYGDIVQIDQTVYDNLVNGKNPFSTAMRRWNELKGASNEEPDNTWLGDDGFIDGWLILAGKGNCYYGTFTDAQIRNAEIAFNSMMAGGSGGNGGSAPVDVGWLPKTGPLYYVRGDGGSPLETYTYDIRGNVDVYGYYKQFFTEYCQRNSLDISDYSFLFVVNEFLTKENISSKNLSGYIYMFDDSKLEVFFSGGRLMSFNNSTDTSTSVYRLPILGGFPAGDVTSESANYVLFGLYTPIESQTVAANASYSLSSAYWCSVEPVGDTSTPKPEPPEPPSPTPPTPDPPEPKDPTPRDPIPKPDPPRVYPKIDLPDVHITTEPTNTEPTDYTPWLRAIYNELKAFHEDFGTYFQDLLDELENHCQHIRDEISTQASYLGDCIEDVATEVSQQGNNLSNTIWEYAEWLSKYMDAFGEWLVEHLDWDNEVNVDPYDDTSLMYWLRRIYTKLGGSNNPINTRPTDPVTNPKDTGNWLNELWETILKDLAQVFPNLMIDLGLIFDDLKSKFPFSIPWDIHALLLLLVTEPVAPHFTIPMYALNTSYELEVVGEYDIDLSFYTDYLMGVHLMLEIAWIGYMLKHTKDYMELIEAVIPT